MIPIGIFAKTFPRSTLDETLEAVSAHGINLVQFNMSCAGLASLPDAIDPSTTARIRAALSVRELEMAAVSGTFNMIHPDEAIRQNGLQRLSVLASACAAMGTNVITLCTGTRDPEDMWRRHPQNDSADAWQDLLTTMVTALRVAEDCGVTLAFEPEVSNVVDSAVKGRKLLDEMRSPHLRVVMDAANLFHPGDLRRMQHIIDEAFDLLGGDMILAHAKDLSRDGEAGHEAAGQGVLDYDHYVAKLAALPREVPLILHSLTEAQVDSSIAFLRSKGAGPATGGPLGSIRQSRYA